MDADKVFVGYFKRSFSDLAHEGRDKEHSSQGIGSGRYPVGSGDNPYQHDDSFLGTVRSLKAEGMSDNDIAKYLKMSTTEYRAKKSLSKQEEDAARDSLILHLKNDEHWSNIAIAEKIGKSESFVRYRLNNQTQERAKVTSNISTVLQDAVEKNRFIDIGEGSQVLLGVSKTRFKTAVKQLKDEGYKEWYVKVEQATNPGNYTYVDVLAAPDTTYKETYANRDKIGFVTDFYMEDNGHTLRGIEPVASISSDRILVRYAEDGGKEKDGVIEIRPGVEDLSLGNNHYAQVRIGVDGTHYLKGMALYSDRVPEGYDIVFNSNKPAAKGKTNAFKAMEVDPKTGEIDINNPFKSSLRMEEGRIVGQSHYIDKNGEEKLSAINIVRQEGDWKTWSKTLASQFLSKQPEALIKQQLNQTYDEKKEEYDSLISLTNPEVKAKLLESFADDCDASASHLKAAALPRQATKVILPLVNIADNEIYAPTFRDGEEVILIRYPHGGKFEIPRLIVNNKNPEGIRVLGNNTPDAVGINAKVAEILSGADFDGDTVTVIPTRGQAIVNQSPLDGLKNFDPKERYPYYDGMKVMGKKQTQIEMGKVSNLITDMTLQGADENELARAVRHSMVVIDARKHKLNYKQSFIDNDIKSLKTKYQGGPNKGASTLISKAGKEIDINERVEKTSKVLQTEEDRKWLSEHNDIQNLTKEEKAQYRKLSNRMTEQELKDYESGKKIFRETGATKKKAFIDINGNKSYVETDEKKTQKSTMMREHDNAFDLSSGTRVENLYAEYANKMKKIATDARKELRDIQSTKRNSSAAEAYKSEVDSLISKLNTAIANKPYERKAQLLTSKYLSIAKKDNPEMDKEEETKLRTQYLTEFRNRVGSSRRNTSISITPKEWEAIQAGALSSSRIKEILNNTDMSIVQKYATPRQTVSINSKQEIMIKNMIANGYTISEIADSLGVSTSTVSNYSKGD